MEKEEYRQAEKKRWKIQLIVTLLALLLAVAFFVMVYSFDYFGFVKLGTLWDLYKASFAILTIGFLTYLTWLSRSEQKKIQKLIERVTENSVQLEKNSEVIQMLNENITRLFYLRQVSGLHEFLKVLVRILEADGGVIFFAEGKAQTMIETSDGQSLEMQEAAINKVKEVYAQGKAAYFDTISLEGKIQNKPETLKFSLITLPLNFEGKLVGLVGFWREKNHFKETDYEQIKQLSKGMEIAMANAYLLNEKEDMLKGLAEELIDWIELEAPTRRGHAREVAYLAGRIAEEMGLSDFEVREIQLAGLIHDIGLGGVDKLVLEKPGKLSPEERKEVERHVELGKSILEKARFPQRIVSMVYSHHEKCDGTGYPLGLKREQIPLGSRIIAVADVFDALTHRRAHRGAEDNKEVLRLLQKGVPKRFDPQVVQAFFQVWEDETANHEPTSEPSSNYH